MLYCVVSEGRISPGMDLEQVGRNLLDLFKTDSKRIKALIERNGMKVKSGLDHPRALKYCEALKKAGLVCRIESLVNSQAMSGVQREDAQTVSPKPHEASPEALVLNVVDPVIAQVDLKYSVAACNKISGTDGGIDLNRLDFKNIPFTDISLVSVFQDVENLSNELEMMFFVKGVQRPFVIKGFKIQFNSFPGVSSAVMLESLRKFVHFLCTQNQDILVDAGTKEFVGGGKVPLLEKGIPRWATSLAGCIVPEDSREAEKINNGKRVVSRQTLEQKTRKSSADMKQDLATIGEKAKAHYQYNDNRPMEHEEQEEVWENISPKDLPVVFILGIAVGLVAILCPDLLGEYDGMNYKKNILAWLWGRPLGIIFIIGCSVGLIGIHLEKKRLKESSSDE